MATDFTKMPLEILVDLINQTNGCALTTADVSFSAPTVLTNASRNTGMLITATPGSPYSGSRNVTYNRVDMGMIPGLRSTEFTMDPSWRYMHEVVPTINAAYNLNLQPEDYYDDVLPDFSDSTLNNHNFLLRAKPGSYVYINMLVLTAVGGKTLISDYLTQNLLSGFILPTISQLSGDNLLNGFAFPSPPPAG
jgi:hypothetical protein